MKNIANLKKLGDALSYAVAKFGGSWSAILVCSSLILIWILFNTWILSTPIDPYPYILLNLVLSCVASLQAPFILMADARKDLVNNQKLDEDLEIDKKAEKEIREVLEKLDRMHQDIIAIRHNNNR